jgi:GMP synthase-like glutamine amidotransferase
MIGIVNMYRNSDKLKPLLTAVRGLGYRVHLGTICEVAESPIKTWIFSGADHDVTEQDAIQVPLELLRLKKRYLMICYSMESVLYQMGYPIYRRANEKGYFSMDMRTASKGRFTGYRNHHYYFRSSDVPSLASYNGELMMTAVGPALLVQFHPEQSYDGRRLLARWLKS